MRLLLSLLTLLFFSSCGIAQYAVLEKFGIDKRDILVDRVEEGREDQAAAKEQIQTTFEAFQELTGFDGGDAGAVYSKLKKEFERSEDRAEKVSSRIESIEQVAGDMFDEWEAEIEGMTDAKLRSKSTKLRSDTQKRYAMVLNSMRTAESKMQPVLESFRNHVVFLKHSLNATAISSLKDDALAIESDVADLIRDMQESIDEADAFIESMETPEA